MSDIDNLLKEGIAALKAGQRVRARALLQEVVREQPDNVAAWLWLSGTVDTDNERRECLERVLEVDPDNPHAKKGLERLGPRTARKLSAPMAVITEKPHPPSKMQTCPHCGMTVQGQHKFCTVCGRALIAPTITTAYPPRSELLDREKALPSAAPRREKRKKGTKGKLSDWQKAIIIGATALLATVSCCLLLSVLPSSVPSAPPGTQVPTIVTTRTAPTKRSPTATPLSGPLVVGQEAFANCLACAVEPPWLLHFRSEPGAGAGVILGGVRHGDRVTIVDAERSAVEGKWWYLVDGWDEFTGEVGRSVSGWVPGKNLTIGIPEAYPLGNAWAEFAVGAQEKIGVGVWNHPGYYTGAKVVGEIWHGTRVEIIATEWDADNGVWFYQVSGRDYQTGETVTGWVDGVFLILSSP